MGRGWCMSCMEMLVDAHVLYQQPAVSSVPSTTLTN